MICSKTVFRCFKALERLGDRVTGAAGPFFVGFAVTLISAGTICFFHVIMPSLSYPWITGPICVLIAFNLLMHYYLVITTNPGFADEPPRTAGTGFLWARPKSSGRTQSRPLTNGVRWSHMLNITKAALTKCRKCGGQKPEWINQCVGIYNERHFVLFMAYLCIATFCFCVLGYRQFLDALGVTFKVDPWPYHVPILVYILEFILASVICFAVSIMLSFHLWTIGRGETSVEGQDNEVYGRIAKSRGEAFVNCYDLG
ncbi:hypothetical protein D9757_011442 [Collybiopsis confluens]|uniref:Palmitoyltransferase n=1 Tax=Collybiopsis confluens TaxID=2823264 RepID=A0A8H5LPP8_9AGAR|nr:hypothetical protein D9757_013561 [Collybiopsis confluens]KAF5365017.1 hypothetical protein D9757_011442 [Collybiopsis confluens]